MRLRVSAGQTLNRVLREISLLVIHECYVDALLVDLDDCSDRHDVPVRAVVVPHRHALADGPVLGGIADLDGCQGLERFVASARASRDEVHRAAMREASVEDGGGAARDSERRSGQVETVVRVFGELQQLAHVAV